jgi:hypothetical protein
MDSGNNVIITECLDEFLTTTIYPESNENENNEEDSIDLHDLFITMDAGDLADEVKEKTAYKFRFSGCNILNNV